MTAEPLQWESRHGRVVVDQRGTTMRLHWLSDRPGQNPDVGQNLEMVRYDSAGGLLRIFPKKTTSLEGFSDQFDQVRELQLETSVCDWDPAEPVDEGDSGELELVGLPSGFGKIFAYGLGLPRPYRGIVRAIESMTNCDTVRFGASDTEGIDNNCFRLNIDRFHAYKAAVDRNRRRGTTVVGRVNDVEASSVIAEITGQDPGTLTLGRHPSIQAITRAVTDETPLDDVERSALVARMRTESKQIADADPIAFGKLRHDIELVSLEVLIEQFANGLRGAMAKDEGRWQAFFETNSFALQQLFAAPVALYGSQLHLRMPNMYGGGARVADFVLVNVLTRSAVVVEIKTPSTPLLGARYRGAGGAEVYPPHSQLSGAVAQLQAQTQSARTDFQSILCQTPGAETVETSTIRGAVIAGNISSLGQDERFSFFRYRDGLHAIEILTYDEVLHRLKGLHSMLSEDAPSPN